MSIKEHPPQQTLHVPVLLRAVIDRLNPALGENYLDLTAGYGGHASHVLDITKNYSESVLVDRDDYAIDRLKPFADKGVKLLHMDFVSASKQLVETGKKFNLVLVDLGVSSPQLDQSERGFSFTNSGPLDMRMDRRQSLSAETLLNTASVKELTRIIHLYGEEPEKISREIAEAIVKARPLYETKELADLVLSLHRGKRGKIHPATRTFQAIRIAVNDELNQVEELLPLLPKLLKSGGRVGVISFHSLEDRLVKKYFKNQLDSGLEAQLMPMFKKPVMGSTDDVHNPRSRSAKLRVAVKK